MSLMWRPDTLRADARPIAVADAGERRLRAQVWGTLLVANLVASIVGIWLVGTAIL